MSAQDAPLRRRLLLLVLVAVVPLAAMAGLGLLQLVEDQRAQAKRVAAGFDAHLVKPVDMGALEALLARGRG